VFARTGVALFPETVGVPLTLLEAAASGATTVAPGRADLSFVVDPAVVSWQDSELISLQERAQEQCLTTAWDIHNEFSALSETRSLGRLLGVEALSDMGGVTAILVASEDSDAAATTFVHDVAGLVDVLIVTGDEVLARRIAAEAAHGMQVVIAGEDGDLAVHIRATTKPSWWVWPVDPARLGEPAGLVLRTLLTGLGSDPQPLLAAHSMLELTDQHLSEAARPRR
jgi:hypothetical protein